MKKLTLLTLVLLFFASCHSTKPVIVTSKEEAIEQGIYQAPKAKKAVAKKDTKPEKAKKESKKTNSKAKVKESKVAVAKPDEETVFVNELIATAMKYSGVRYQYGGNNFSGIDCSGLVCTVYRTHDISLPRTSRDLSKIGKKIKLKRVKKGDLVFFKTSRRHTINHVGIVTDVVDGEVFFIHASTSSGVVVSSLYEAYYKKAFAKFSRVLDEPYL